MRADALSRREQDMPTGVTDDRLQFRMVQLIKPKMIKEDSYGSIMVSPVTIQEQGIRDLSQNDITDQFLHLQLLPDDLQLLWKNGLETDRNYLQMVKAIYDGMRTFPAILGVRVSISECSLSDQQALLFRGRYWVPDLDELRTRIIQVTHDSLVTGHPGRESTIAILMR